MVARSTLASSEIISLEKRVEELEGVVEKYEDEIYQMRECLDFFGLVQDFEQWQTTTKAAKGGE
ncbi:hypothetical protein OAF54_00720 [bacterium]|nr:hypothetical protein [bacterium]